MALDQDARLPVIRRSLLDRPQRLGILPTLWFWNDYERQRLLWPLIVVTSFPLAAVVTYITLRFGLSMWWTTTFIVVYGILVQGLVERHVRKQLVAQPAEELLDRATPELAARSAWSSRRPYLVLAGLCSVATLLAAFEVTGLAALGVMLVAVAAALLPSAAAYASKRLTARRSDDNGPLPPVALGADERRPH